MNVLRRFVLVLAFMLVSPLALAQNANPYLDAGMRLYGDFEYEAALDQLTKASSFPGNAPATEIQIAIYRALIKLELGDQPGAELDLKTALALDPDAKLPAGVSPKISEVFERVHKEIVSSRPPAPVVTSPQPVAAQAQPQPQQTQPVAAQPQPAQQAQGSTTFVFVPPPPVSQGSSQQQPAQPVDVSARAVPAPEVAPEVVSGSAPPKLAEPQSRASRVIAAVLIGAGAALGGGGAYFGVQSSNSVQDARSAEFRSDGEDCLDRARSQALTANVMYGAATAAVVSGVITLFAGE